MIVKARSTCAAGTRRRNISTSGFPLKVLKIAAAATATVLVFMPPPVDPGEAPISMKMMINVVVDAGSAAMSNVVNPAVRDETDRKSASNQPIQRSLITPKNQISTAPPAIRIRLVSNTTLECTRR